MTRPLKRSVTIDGHRTSISLEPEFWQLLQQEADKRHLPLARLIKQIDRDRAGNLSSAIRVWLLQCVQARAGD